MCVYIYIYIHIRYIVLHYVMLHYVMLYYVRLCYVVLCYVMLYVRPQGGSAAPSNAIIRSRLYYITWHYIIIITLFYIMLQCITYICCVCYIYIYVHYKVRPQGGSAALSMNIFNVEQGNKYTNKQYINKQ